MRMLSVRLVASMLLMATLVGATGVAQGAPSPAPAFSLDLFSGKTLTLADLKGTAVILLFWAQW
jgi:cytochrome oxidase Cu insertion factor (SCO1/SenC/PrrC family)